MTIPSSKFSLSELSGLVKQLTMEELQQKDRHPNLRRTVTFGTPEEGIYVTIGYPFSINAKTLENIWLNVEWFTVNLLHYKYTINADRERVFYYICRQHQGTSNKTEEGDSIHPVKKKEDIDCPCEGGVFRGSFPIHSENIFEWTKKIVKAGRPVDCDPEELTTVSQPQSTELESKDDPPPSD